jgi:hypothetical protein
LYIQKSQKIGMRHPWSGLPVAALSVLPESRPTPLTDVASFQPISGA